jgi:hypothetical protein
MCSLCCAHIGFDKESEVLNKSTGFPLGWKLFKQFVHVDGRVFEYGVENELLKDKLTPTEIKPIKKLSKRERLLKQELKDKKQAEKYNFKMTLKKKDKPKKTKVKR